MRPGGHEKGIAFADILVGMSLLGIVMISLTNLFLSAMKLGKSSGIEAEAATWAQAEIDHLRGLSFTNSCLAQGTRTLTPSSAGCASLEPPLSIDFPKATVQVEDNALGRTGLKRITLQVYLPASTVYYRVVTYATQLT